MQLRLLNRTVTIKRKDVTENGISDTGDIIKSEETTVATGVPIRITNNEAFNPDIATKPGGWMSASFLGFTLVGVDVKINDFLEDEASGLRYYVAWVDEIPGGVPDDHYEIYMNDSRTE